ncbi:hypothetical protein Pla100_24480 [Neorhodopirellula pilleata]|uniref:Uncharacterized protein n=1 Tax=Neorhodopirellula pilleata TaxID=2714738 RepID=A0A5C6AD04_9BACT|nr:hypothetical protein Pla100_24480 [Neorhodopirellula pilleata]
MSGGLDIKTSRDMKLTLKRIVSMLTRMAIKFDGVGEPSVDDAAVTDYELEHRDAEHEYERKPEPRRAPEDCLRGFTNGNSFVRPR